MDPESPIDMISTNGRATASEFWVDTFTDAPVYDAPTATSPTGMLNGGRNDVFGKVLGPKVG